jgi:predicted ester cyclase
MYKPFYEFIRQILPEFKIDVAVVEPLLESRKVYKGEFLFREGDVCDFVGLTLSGCLRTFFLKDAKELTLFFHAEHQPLGDYESFRKQRPACFSCQAIEDSEVLLVNHQVIHAFEVAPDGRHTFSDVIAENDLVVTRGTFSGTYSGEIMGIPPTGKQVTFSVIHIDRVMNGKIVEHWGQGDTMALMQQLDVVPKY